MSKKDELTKKQKEAQAEEDAFKHMMEDAIAQEMAKVEREIMRCKTEDQLQSVMRLSKLLITDD